MNSCERTWVGIGVMLFASSTSPALADCSSCLVGVGGGLTTRAFSQELSSRTTGELAPGLGLTGLAGGDKGPPTGEVWASYINADIKNTLPATAFNSDVDIALVGGHFRPRSDMIVGIYGGSESFDATTGFDSGSQDGSAFRIVPYFVYIFKPNIFASFNLGYRSGDIDNTRRPAGAPITGNIDFDGWTFYAELNGRQNIGGFTVTGNVAYLYETEERDAFTESNGNTVSSLSLHLSQGLVGGDIGYALHAGEAGTFEPYVTAHYAHDFSRTEVRPTVGAGANIVPGSNEVRWGLGLRYRHGSGVSGDLVWTQTSGRDNFDLDVLRATLRYEF